MDIYNVRKAPTLVNIVHINTTTHFKRFPDSTTDMVFQIQVVGQCDTEVFDSGDPR